MAKLLRGALKVLAWVAIPAALVLVLLRVFYVDVVVMGHNGMAPTVLSGDEVLVWRGATANHGDILLCRHPSEEGRFVIGRAIAMPGMSLSVDRGGLLINDASPTPSHVAEVDFVDPTRDGVRRRLTLGIEQLGNDRYFTFSDDARPLRIRPIAELQGIYLLGDHRGYPGEDSRTFGAVDPSSCIGQVFLRFSPGDYDVEGVPHGWLDMLRAPL